MARSVFSVGEHESVRTRKLNLIEGRVADIEAGGGAGPTTVAYSDITGVPTGTVLYRKTTGTGPAEAQSLATLKTDLALAAVASSGAYADLTGKPVLATVATSGAYSDLTGRPTLATVATTGAYSDLTGRPTLATVATTGSAADLTGTLAATQLPALTGAITTSAGSAATSLATSIVTLANMANVATGTVFYRKTTGTGVPEVQTLATLKTDLGLTGVNSGDQTISITGDVTASGSTGSLAATVTKLNGVALSGLATGILKNTTATGVPSIAVAADFPTLNQNTTGSAATLTTSRNFSITGGGITAAAVGFNGSGNVALSASVDAGHITLARMADVATGTVFYRKTAGAGAPEVQTLATLKTDLGLTGTNSGDQTITLTGDVTGSGTGSFATTIGANKVTDAMLAQVATATFKGRVTAGTGNVEVLTGTQATTLLDTFTSTLKGLAPASGGGTANFLRADGTWAAPSGGGGTTTNALTFNNGGAGAASGSTFNGSAAVTVSYNTVGAAAASHTHGYTDIVSVPTGSLLYRKTAGTGAAEMQTLATLKTDLGLTGTNSGDQTITLTGDVTGSGTGSFATAIGAGKVTRAMMKAGTVGAGVVGMDGGGVVTDYPFGSNVGIVGGFVSLYGTLAGSAFTMTTNRLIGRTTAATGTPEELTPTAVTAMLNAATTSLQGMMSAADKTRLDALYAPYRTIIEPSGSHTAARVAGTYAFGHGDPLAITGTGTLYPIDLIYIDSADYPAIGSLTAKLRIRVTVSVNDVAPTGNYTFGLYPVTRPATSGGAGLNIYTLGTVVTGSTVLLSAPAADSINNVVGSDFALPANGHYCIGVVTTATVAASSHLHLSACLQLHHT